MQQCHLREAGAPRQASSNGFVRRRPRKYEGIHHGGKGNPGLGRTSNPLAAPEALGVSRGATIAVLLVVVSTTALDPVLFSIGATTGAFTVSAGIGLVLARGRVRPERTLLGGLAVTMMATGWASACRPGCATQAGCIPGADGSKLGDRAGP